MSKHAIQVAVRTRPTASFASKNLEIDEDTGVRSLANHMTAPGQGVKRPLFPQAINVQLDPSSDAVSNRQDHWKFKFNDLLYNSGLWLCRGALKHVCNDCSAGQEDVFDRLVAPVVSGVMSGTNGCIMAYGQTGAGKTYTMLGDQRIYSNRGVSPRAISAVFAEISSRPETDFSVQVSYLEIYNERIYDLLLPPGSAAPTEYALAENKRGGIVVRGLTTVPVQSEEEALHQLFSGQGNRTTAQHQLNGQSNRSHCIFSLHVSQRSRLGTAERTLHSKLNLVDLAGSERLKKTMTTTGGLADETLSRESMFINKSLSHLEQCVVALTASGRSHIPYRSSKLTNILKDSLGGNCATLLIACVWGEASHLEETLSTLKLAQRMMRVTNRTSESVTLDPALLAKRYEKQIAQLQQELLMHDALSDRSAVVYSEYTPEQRQQLASQLQAYIAADSPQAEDAALQIDSVRMMRELLVQMKIMARGWQAQLEDGGGGGRAASSMSGGGASARAPSAAGGYAVDSTDGAADRGDNNISGELVGELSSTGGGVGLGLAPPGSRPDDMHASRLLATQRRAQAAEDSALAGTAGGSNTPRRHGEGKASEEGGAADSAQSRDEAWGWYRSAEGPGHGMAGAVAEAYEAHRHAKAQFKAVGRTVNAHKRSIDQLSAGVERRRAEAERSGVPVDETGEVIVDEEEFRLRSELTDAKRAYKGAYGELKQRQGEADAAARELMQAKQVLVHAFEAWFEDSYGGHMGSGMLAGSGIFSSPAPSPLRSPGGGTVGFGGDASVAPPLQSTWTSPSKSVRKGSPGRGGSTMSARDMHATAATAAALLGRGASAPRGALRNEHGDVLDDGEAFERMEFERIVGEDPDSVAYFAAQKKLANSMKGGLSVTQRRSLAQRRMS